MIAYLRTQRIVCLPIIAKAVTSGRYNKGTKKYVNVSLGGSGSSAVDGILSDVSSLGSITPAYAFGNNVSMMN